jgi:eukaryotic-like serine/threonine-protein kinase
MPFKTCSYCSQKIPADANFCPYCTRPTGSRLWIWLRLNATGVILGVALASVLLMVWNRSQDAQLEPTQTEAQIAAVPTEPPATAEPSTPIIELSVTPVMILTSTFTPEPIEIATREASKDNMVQVHIPAGEFNMGLDGGDDNEKPMHTVYLDEYWIDRTEVTNAQYALCVAAGNCEKPEDLESQPSSLFIDKNLADHPVVFVDWNQAKAYCTWAGRRLPTEAEWERAARGTDERIYPWGVDFDGTKVNYCDVNCWASWKDSSNNDGYGTTSPVGTFPDGASPYGALDMAGNAYEWVLDWFSLYTSEYQNNPIGPVSGSEHVLRGGSWGDDILHLRIVLRTDEPSDFRRDFIGFRCAQ